MDYGRTDETKDSQLNAKEEADRNATLSVSKIEVSRPKLPHDSNKGYPPRGEAQAPDGTFGNGYIFPVTALRYRMLQQMKEEHFNQQNFLPLSPSQFDEVCQILGGHGHEHEGGFDILVNTISLSNSAAARPSFTTKKPRLLCAVYTHEGNHEKLKALGESWGWRCDGFFAASTITDVTIGAVNLTHEGPEEYNNMWQKSRSIWAYIYDSYYNDFDFFWLGGDDVHVIVENMIDYLWNLTESIGQHRSETEPLYLGHLIQRAGNLTYVGGGPGYLFNRVTLKKMVTDVLPSCYADRRTSSEDRFMSICAATVGIFGNDTADEQGKQRFHVMDSGYVADFDGKDGYFGRVYGFWGQKHGFKAGSDIVSRQSVAFHFLHYPPKMKRHHAIIYRSCPDETLLGISINMKLNNVSIDEVGSHLRVPQMHGL